jgi:sialic acid synthase SpsE
MPNTHPVEDAIQAALDCGADLVKLQWFRAAGRLSMRRGGVEGLGQWKLSTVQLMTLIDKFADKLGLSVFDPEDVEALSSEAVYGNSFDGLAFLKSATQEYQYAILAETMSRFSAGFSVPLYVSIPRDGCLVMGNYWSSQKVTWLQCAPEYPASPLSYSWERQAEMARRLPGNHGLSDHTPGSTLLESWKYMMSSLPDRTDLPKCCSVVEKHFCYHESLRGVVPDGGPWSLSQADFKKYVEVAHGQG